MGRLVDEVLERTGKKKRDRFHLMNKDEILCSFSLGQKTEAPIIDLHIISELYRHLPFSVQEFIKIRKPNKHREHMIRVLQLCGVEDTVGLIEFSKMMSLNDTLWVKKETDNIEWNKVSLYRNDFDEVIAKTAFDGGLYGDIMSTTTPELSTVGQFPKCWKRNENNIFLYKAGTEGAANAGLEPYSEFLADQVLEVLDINHVKYWLEKIQGKVSSVCKLFTSESIGYQPYGHIFRHNYVDYDLVRKDLEDLGLLKEFNDILVFDSLIMNPDRHLGNFGFLVDNKTFKILDIAPVFDNNLSLNCYAIEEDFKDIDFYMNDTRKKHFLFEESTFEEIGKELCSNEMKKKVRKLFDFEFKNHDKYPLPDWRINELSKLVQRQAKFICS